MDKTKLNDNDTNLNQILIIIVGVIGIVTVLTLESNNSNKETHQATNQAEYRLKHLPQTTITKHVFTKGFDYDENLKQQDTAKNLSQQVNAYLNSVKNIKDYQVKEVSNDDDSITLILTHK